MKIFFIALNIIIGIIGIIATLLMFNLIELMVKSLPLMFLLVFAHIIYKILNKNNDNKISNFIKLKINYKVINKFGHGMLLMANTLNILAVSPLLIEAIFRLKISLYTYMTISLIVVSIPLTFLSFF